MSEYTITLPSGIRVDITDQELADLTARGIAENGGPGVLLQYPVGTGLMLNDLILCIMSDGSGRHICCDTRNMEDCIYYDEDDGEIMNIHSFSKDIGVDVTEIKQEDVRVLWTPDGEKEGAE